MTEAQSKARSINWLLRCTASLCTSIDHVVEDRALPQSEKILVALRALLNEVATNIQEVRKDEGSSDI